MQWQMVIFLKTVQQYNLYYLFNDKNKMIINNINEN
jgi:hypothetical protein